MSFMQLEKEKVYCALSIPTEKKRKGKANNYTHAFFLSCFCTTIKNRSNIISEEKKRKKN